MTGDVGEVIAATVTLESSTLGDSTANVDPTPGNDSDTYTTAPITLDGDLALSTRLLTSGEIENGDTVEYELTISNIGGGDYLVLDGAPPLGVYFIIPEGATFVSVTDPDPEDNYSLVDGTCGSLGDESNNIPVFAELDAELAGCHFESATDSIPAGGSSEC